VESEVMRSSGSGLEKNVCIFNECSQLQKYIVG